MRHPLMNEVASPFEDLVPWAVDWFTLLAMEPDNFDCTPSFGMLFIALSVSSSLLDIETILNQRRT